MKNVVKSKKFGKFWLSCALFCSQLTCGMATKNQESQDNVKIDGKTLREYLNGGFLSRKKVREDLKKLDIDSAKALKAEVNSLPPSKRKNIFYEEMDMFASLDEVLQEVENWGDKDKGADRYENLFREDASPSIEDYDVFNVICWLDAMKWMEGCEKIEELKKRCQDLKGALAKFL